jgi:hypothetical protein
MRFHDKAAADAGDVTFERIPQAQDGASHRPEYEARSTSGRTPHSLLYGKDTP